MLKNKAEIGQEIFIRYTIEVWFCHFRVLSSGIIRVVFRLDAEHCCENGDINTFEKERNAAPQELPGNMRSMGSFGSRNVSHLANVVFKLGEKESGLRPLISSVQDFAQIKQKCLDAGVLFEDPEFPAQPSTMYGTEKVRKDITWMRPPEMVSDPEFFVSGASRFDVNQEEIGDCWLLAALSSLVMHQELFSQVVVDNQSFEKGQYAGIFHFRSWKYGRWLDVVIDDRLPMHEGALIGARSTATNEFWTALLEKAYAKLHGSYEALNIGGWSGEALEDFTGGVVERYDADDAPPDLFSIMLKAQKKISLMTCVLKGSDEDNADEEDNEIENDDKDAKDKEDNEDDIDLQGNKKFEGVYANHEYSITQVKYVHEEAENGKQIPLVRLRNPWGNNDEWRGAWSDGSPEWDSISNDEKKELGVKPEITVDGEFWMYWEDFKFHFAFIEICHLNPTSLTDENLSRHTKKWKISAFEGEWVREARAGGPNTDLEKFRYNPQYCITLEEKSTVIVALMQKNKRAGAQFTKNSHFLQTGYTVYPISFWSNLMKISKLKGLPSEKLSKPLDLSFFENSKTKALDIDFATDKSAPRYMKIAWGREAVCRIKLIPGTYCIVSHTKDPGEEGEFLLRVFSETANNLEEYDLEVSIVDRKILDESFNERLRDLFQRLASEDSELDWMEHKKFLDTYMLQELSSEGFNKEICRSIVSMLDLDKSGKVGFHEFKTFWPDIQELSVNTSVFVLHRHCKCIPGNQRRDEGCCRYIKYILPKKGFEVSWLLRETNILGRLVRRHGSNDEKITFEDFILCAVRFKTMFNSFKEHDLGRTNAATFNMEEWFDETLCF